MFVKGRPLTARERAKVVVPLSRLSRRFWIKACRFDATPESSAFVNFSKDNPYVRLVDRAKNLMFAYLDQNKFPHAKPDDMGVKA